MKVAWPIVILIWAGFFLLKFPVPMVDDLCYSGPAISLVEGTGYQNPYCPRLDHWGAHGNFFIYTPLHAYVLAGWLKVLGISRWILDLFQCCAGAVASLALVKLFDCTRRKVFSAVILSLAVGLVLVEEGLRPDALGLALFFNGLLIFRARHLWSWILCSFSLFLAAICTPNFACLVPLLILSVLYLRSELVYPLKKETIYRVAGTILAAGVVFVLFLVMIHFELRTFWIVFSTASKNAPNYWYEMLLKRIVPISIHFAILAAMTFSALFVAKARPALFEVRITWRVIIVVLVGMIYLVSVYLKSAKGNLWLDTYLVLILLWLTLHLKGPDRRVYLSTGLVFMFMVAHHRVAIVELTLVPLTAPSIYQPGLKTQIEAAHADRVYIDPFALAAIYNYQLPPHTYDYTFGLDKDPVTLEDLPRNSLLVISPVYFVNDDRALAPALFGHMHANWAMDPYKFVLIKSSR